MDIFQEAKNLLGTNAPDEDAHTRGQQKKIEDIQAEKPSPKKPKLSKNTTMAATAKVLLYISSYIIQWVKCVLMNL